MSSIILARRRPCFCMTFRKFIDISLSAILSSIRFSRYPFIIVRGVRSSWEALATKSFLTRSRFRASVTSLSTSLALLNDLFSLSANGANSTSRILGSKSCEPRGLCFISIVSVLGFVKESSISLMSLSLLICSTAFNSSGGDAQPKSLQALGFVNLILKLLSNTMTASLSPSTTEEIKSSLRTTLFSRFSASKICSIICFSRSLYAVDDPKDSFSFRSFLSFFFKALTSFLSLALLPRV